MTENSLTLQKSKLLAGKSITVCGSKSISNRLLILQKLFGNISLVNLSTSQDTELLKNALSSAEQTVDIHHAGTAMRFLTAYFSVCVGRNTILTGSERMQQRPIKPLVDALRDLGAEIEYLGKEGFPPLKITGKTLVKNKVEIEGNISSQFITALLLVAAALPNGLLVSLKNKVTSRPYLEMTLKILKEIGVETTFLGNEIAVKPLDKNLPSTKYIVESDWSSASYFYSIAAIGREKIALESFRKNSLQADIAAAKIYREYFGIETIFEAGEKITLRSTENYTFPKEIILDMNDCPDIAQTVCVTAAALKIPFRITGLETLKVKETDRLLALKAELAKIGCETEITEDSIKSTEFRSPERNIFIKTYNDHRMAMSFAPFSLLRSIAIENPGVVEKSYPDFWKDFESITAVI